MAVTTREELKQYALRSLGSPVIQINVADSQLEDRLDEALQMYADQHYDATVESYMGYAVQQADLDNGYITLPNDVIYVVKMLSLVGSQANQFTVQWQVEAAAFATLTDVVGGGMVDYVLRKQNLAMVQQLLSGAKVITFSRHMNRVKIEGDYAHYLTVGDFVMFHCYKTIVAEDFPSIYNDTWLKKYTVALFKKQWGSNLGKFSEIVLLGGITLRGDAIFSEALEEIEKLEEQLEKKYTVPPAFFIG